MNFPNFWPFEIKIKKLAQENAKLHNHPRRQKKLDKIKVFTSI